MNGHADADSQGSNADQLWTRVPNEREGFLIR